MSELLKEGEDYYLNEAGFMVFTEAYHLRRGYCCGSGCRHCPYAAEKEKDPSVKSQGADRRDAANEQ